MRLSKVQKTLDHLERRVLLSDAFGKRGSAGLMPSVSTGPWASVCRPCDVGRGRNAPRFQVWLDLGEGTPLLSDRKGSCLSWARNPKRRRQKLPENVTQV